MKNFDYSSNGAYFITISAYKHFNIFGDIINDEMLYNRFGKIAEEEILKTNEYRKAQGICIKKWVVMPNHIHMIVEIYGAPFLICSEDMQTERFSQPTKSSVPTVIRAYKSAVTRAIRLSLSENEKETGILGDGHGTPCPYKIWQRDYHDHRIRTDKEYERIWSYIENNPILWNKDCFKDM